MKFNKTPLINRYLEGRYASKSDFIQSLIEICVHEPHLLKYDVEKNTTRFAYKNGGFEFVLLMDNEQQITKYRIQSDKPSLKLKGHLLDKIFYIPQPQSVPVPKESKPFPKYGKTIFGIDFAKEYDNTAVFVQPKPSRTGDAPNIGAGTSSKDTSSFDLRKISTGAGLTGGGNITNSSGNMNQNDKIDWRQLNMNQNDKIDWRKFEVTTTDMNTDEIKKDMQNMKEELRKRMLIQESKLLNPVNRFVKSGRFV